jgi:hypothetical protein
MNDERPIEKLLRRYAKKRRDEAGDPLALHPATRRLLQGEVARQYPKSAPEEGRTSAVKFFALLTRRWIYAVGLFVVLGVTAVVLWPTFKSDNQALMAQKDGESLAVRESLAPAPATAPAPDAPAAESQLSKLALAESARNQPESEPASGGNFTRLRDESATLSFSVTNSAPAGALSRFADAKADADSLRESEESKRFSRSVNLSPATPANRGLTTQSPARSAGEPVVTDSLSVAQSTKESLDARVDRYNEARQRATPSPAPAAAPLSVSTTTVDKNVLARGGGVEQDAERFYSQSFANVAPEQLRAQAAKAKGEAPAAVLTKFQIQQVGNQVRVIDGDGSTYLGELNRTLATDAPTGTAGRETASVSFENATQRTAGTAAQESNQSYHWRVEGTNRTLNQNVVFSWNFVETTNRSATSQLNAVSGLVNQESLKLPSQFPVLLNNSIINGRAQLGPAQQIEVNAVPVK